MNSSTFGFRGSKSGSDKLVGDNTPMIFLVCCIHVLSV